MFNLNFENLWFDEIFCVRIVGVVSDGKHHSSLCFDGQKVSPRHPSLPFQLVWPVALPLTLGLAEHNFNPIRKQQSDSITIAATRNIIEMSVLTVYRCFYLTILILIQPWLYQWVLLIEFILWLRSLSPLLDIYFFFTNLTTSSGAVSVSEGPGWCFFTSLWRMFSSPSSPWPVSQPSYLASFPRKEGVSLLKLT